MREVKGEKGCDKKVRECPKGHIRPAIRTSLQRLGGVLCCRCCCCCCWCCYCCSIVAVVAFLVVDVANVQFVQCKRK